jgi:hypothetical protein
LRHTRIFAVAVAYFSCSSSPSARRRVMRPPDLHANASVRAFCRCPNFDALRLILRHSPTTFSRVIAFWARRRCSRAVHERADRRVPSKCVGRQTP